MIKSIKVHCQRQSNFRFVNDSVLENSTIEDTAAIF